MRTAGAVIRFAHQMRLVAASANRLQDGQTWRNPGRLTKQLQPRAEAFGNHVGIVLTVHRKERGAVFRLFALDARFVLDAVAHYRPVTGNGRGVRSHHATNPRLR